MQSQQRHLRFMKSNAIKIMWCRDLQSMSCVFLFLFQAPSLSFAVFLSCSVDERCTVEKAFILSDLKLCLSYFDCIGEFESAFDAYRAQCRFCFCRVSVKYFGNSKTQPQYTHKTRCAYTVDSMSKKKTKTTTSTNIVLSFSSSSIGLTLHDALYNCIIRIPKQQQQ